MTSQGDAKVTDTLAPMSDAAVNNLLEFHHRLDQAGKLRSREVQAPFMANFLAEKRKEAAETLLVSTQGPSLISDIFPVEMAVEATNTSKSLSDALEKQALQQSFWKCQIFSKITDSI